MSHTETRCTQVPHTEQYHNKSWSAAFACPVCGKTQRRNLNFLGGKWLLCNGEKVRTVSRWDWEEEKRGAACAG